MAGSTTSGKGPPRADPAAIAAALQLFVEPGQVTELRALNVQANGGWPKTWAGFYDSDHLEEMAKAALQLERTAAGVYFVFNPVHPDLLARRCNRAAVADKELLTHDVDILRRKWFYVDADPKRKKGISSTDAEKAAAWQTILAVKDYLWQDAGWPDPILADSGNGYHALYRIDLPTDDSDLVKRILHALARRFDSERVEIDCSVHNPSRITKLYGTLARKGDNTPERPHRRSCIIEGLS